MTFFSYLSDFKMLAEVLLNLFLLNLGTSNYDSLNITQRLDIFDSHLDTYPPFANLSITQQTEVVNALDENDIKVSTFSLFTYCNVLYFLPYIHFMIQENGCKNMIVLHANKTSNGAFY